MKINSRKQYNNDFKIEAVELIERERYSLSEASVRLGISKSTLSKWKQLFGHNSNPNRSVINSSKESGLTIFEQKQLQKELEKVRRERDILKKALAYFAAEPGK
jgi:transposase